jgi:holliday junction DNA helicase RuvA
MIAFLRGVVAEAYPNRVVLDVHGVGYELLVPGSTAEKVGPIGGTVSLLTHFIVREDEQVLVGFASAPERDMFRLLLKQVSGVGPKVALAVLSGMPVGQFKACVAQGDVTALAKIKGLGKKTAERIILELKDKVGVAEAWREETSAGALSPHQVQANDAVLALVALGYKQVEAHKTVKQLLSGSTEATTADALLREALRLLNQ